MTDRNFAGLNPEAIEGLRREHGEDRVKKLYVQGKIELIVRAPSRAEFDRFMASTLKIQKNTAEGLAAARTLLMDCLLAPDPRDAKAQLDKYPALTEKFAEKVLEMAGADDEVREEAF